MRNEEVLRRVKEERNILQTTKEGRLCGMVTSCIGTAYLNSLLKERYKENRGDGEPRKQA